MLTTQAFAYDAVYVMRDVVLHGHYTRAGVRSYLDRLIRERIPIHGVGANPARRSLGL